jgi:putative protein-disulfide isomerase
MSNDAMACDLETGLCQIPGAAVASHTEVEAEGRTSASTQVTYVTDPICSACWLMEPAWRSLALRYGDLMQVTHVYGGLLPKWDGFSDPGAGIRRAEDVAHHWDEMAARSGQPIDSSVWWSDPIESSYPPSIAVTAVRLSSPQHEERYLRRLRELLFLQGRNIARREVQLEAAASVGLHVQDVAARIDDGSAEHEFHHDLVRAQELGAHSFPTIVMDGPEGRLTVRGFATPEQLEQKFLAVAGATERPAIPDVADAVGLLGVGTTLEYAALMGVSRGEAERRLEHHGLTARRIGTGKVWDPSDSAPAPHGVTGAVAR